ncbi:hypothetical protein [Tenacibaculum aiptasiae]|uniref:hypothetical protein n=1 Tax=Tenacibaculum aiptasiae TaxID=426481 RepID=UPI003B5ABB8A
MKNLLKLGRVLNKTEQQTINGGINFAKFPETCSNDWCSNITGRCCGFDENGNYGCVIAQEGSRNCR